MSDHCIICDIVNLKQKGYVLYEDDLFIVFLDVHPLFIGHTLIAPKKHYETLYDLPCELGNKLLSKVQMIGHAVTKAMEAEGTFVAINNLVSQSINHLHIHIVPRKKGDGLKGFFWPRIKYENEQELIRVQKAIKNEIHPCTGKSHY